MKFTRVVKIRLGMSTRISSKDSDAIFKHGADVIFLVVHYYSAIGDKETEKQEKDNLRKDTYYLGLGCGENSTISLRRRV
jgi:hypothetical protein